MSQQAKRQIPPSVEMKRVSKTLPTEYSMTIIYKSGKEETHEIVSHAIVQTVRINCDNGDTLDKRTGQRYRVEMAKAIYLEFVNIEDEWETVQWEPIEKLKFDKRWSQVLAERQQAK